MSTRIWIIRLNSRWLLQIDRFIENNNVKLWWYWRNVVQHVFTIVFPCRCRPYIINIGDSLRIRGPHYEVFADDHRSICVWKEMHRELYDWLLDKYLCLLFFFCLRPCIGSLGSKHRKSSFSVSEESGVKQPNTIVVTSTSKPTSSCSSVLYQCYINVLSYLYCIQWVAGVTLYKILYII